MNAAEIREQFYDKSNFGGALAAVKEALETVADETERRELLAVGSFSAYHMKDHDLAFNWANEAGKIELARNCLVSLRAYSPKYKDDEELRKLCEELHYSVSACYAVVARARDDDSGITQEEVMSYVERYQGNNIPTAHLWNHAARFFMKMSERDQGNSRQHLSRALLLMEGALDRYGSEIKTLQHRAAANRWKSEILEKLKRHQEAIETAHFSDSLWDEQIAADPTNPQHKKNQSGVREWLGKLIAVVAVLMVLAGKCAVAMAQRMFSLAA